VVDGDIVSGVPSSGFKHIGTNVIVDSKGKGSVIIDPSFVEKYLRMSSKTSIGAHSLKVYRRGLKGVKLATQYLNGQLDVTQNSNFLHPEAASEVTHKSHGDGEDKNGIVMTTKTHRSSSTSTIEADLMKIAQGSSAFVATFLEEDEEDGDDDHEQRREKGDVEEGTRSEMKRHNEEVKEIDQWAAQMQTPTVMEKILTWGGFGKQNEEEELSSSRIVDTETSNTLLHQK
jgi:hypothetical protein